MVWAALSRAPRAIRLQFHEMAITFVTFYALISLCNEALLASCVSPRVDWSREQSSLVNQSTKANTAEGDGKVTASTHSFISPDVKEVHHQSQYTLIFSYFHTFILSYSHTPSPLGYHACEFAFIASVDIGRKLLLPLTSLWSEMWSATSTVCIYTYEQVACGHGPCLVGGEGK